MSLIVDFSIFPIGKGESVSTYVAKAAKIIKESGLPHQLGPMGTTIEGSWEEIAPLISRCLQALSAECPRIYFNLKGDFRKGREKGMEGKVKSLTEKI